LAFISTCTLDPGTPLFIAGVLHHPLEGDPLHHRIHAAVVAEAPFGFVMLTVVQDVVFLGVRIALNVTISANRAASARMRCSRCDGTKVEVRHIKLRPGTQAFR